MSRPDRRGRAARRRPRGLPVVLAATLHDPPGALRGEIRRRLPALARRYAAIAVATSPPTAAAVVRLLAARGVWAGTSRTDARGPLYRLALRAALAAGATLEAAAPGAARRRGPAAAARVRVHYLDFDRALHWLRHGDRELAALLRRAARHRAVLVGRTPAAHRSHQEALVATETRANASMARRLGIPRRVDFLVPSFMLDAAATRRLLARSRARGGAIYGELAALLPGVAPALAYVECAGLDWETPDRDPAGVRRLGLAAWRARFDTPDEWRLRCALARDIVRGFARTLARVPVRRARLHVASGGAARVRSRAVRAGPRDALTPRRRRS